MWRGCDLFWTFCTILVTSDVINAKSDYYDLLGMLLGIYLVISRQIRPLAAFIPTPHIKSAISSFALSSLRGRYAHVYGICAPFYCIILKKYMGGGYNAAKGLITRDNAAYFA